MQVIATSIQDLARETSRQNQELWQAIRKGPPAPRDNNQPPPRGENGSNDQEADSHQVTRRRGGEVERTPPRSRHRAESAGSSAPPSQHRIVKTTRSSKQPEKQDRSSKQPERQDRPSKQPERQDRRDSPSRQPVRSTRSSRDPDDKTARLERELREMRKQMGDMKNSLRAKAARNLDNLVHRADSPFIPRIADFPLPSRFKVPLLENFDGTKDPFDYLEAFKTIMQLQAVPEEVMCRAFPLGLRGSARVWFNKLESESIGSFVQLSRAFIDHFIGSQRRGRPPTHLLSVKQMEGESLRAFVHRFNEEAMKIDRPKEDVTVTAFMAGLRKGDFLYELCKDPPETMSELMYEATKHMNAEDALEAMDDPPPKRRKEAEDRKPEPAKQKVPKFTETPERKRTTAPPAKFSSFTPLNTPIDKLLLQIQDDPSLRWPGKIRSDPNNRPKNLYCRFHRDHGHLTEDCVALKEQVETLIRQGKLQKYVSRPANTRPAKPLAQREQAEHNRPGPVGEIRTIIGGPASGGTSRASRKAYARQVHNIMVVQRPPKNVRLDDQIISFSEEDARGTHQPHDDALVITVNIAGFTTRRVMVDNGSSADILYLPAYQQMRLDKDKLRPMDAPLVGFTGDKVCPVGIVTLPITVGTHPKTVSKTVDFLVVNCPSAYNAIIGRPTLNRLRAVTSTYHLLLKFPTEHGIGEVRGDQVAARECYLASLESGGQNQTMTIEEQKIAVKPSGELDTVELEDGRPERTTKIGANLPPKMKESLVLKQKRRVFAPERNNAIMEEVDKLLAANFIREVFYPDWLANVVMVKKSTGKWRMCVDFTDLNRACPKDSFPGSQIDQLVLLNIAPLWGLPPQGLVSINCCPPPLAHTKRVPHRGRAQGPEPCGSHEDKALRGQAPKRTILSSTPGYQSQGCYKKRVWVLKEGPGLAPVRIPLTTYCPLWQRKLPQGSEPGMLPKDSFPLPRIDQLVDSTAGHKLLTFMDAFSERRSHISTTDEQDVPRPNRPECRSLRRRYAGEVQEEDGHLDDLRETFETLRKYQMKLNPSKCAFGVYSGKFLGFMVSQRGIEANPDKIKAILEMQPPKTTKEVQRLTGRVAALNRFMSRSTDKCLPFFKTLKKAFVWTDECQQAFEGTQEMNKPDAAGRLIQWSIELSEFDIDYRPRTAIKAQFLADFIAEFTLKDDEPTEDVEQTSKWTVNIDDSSTKDAGRVGIVLKSPEGDTLKQAVQLQYPTTNNEAEYETLLVGLKMAKTLEATEIDVLSDSQLVVGQVNGDYEAKEGRMQQYLHLVQHQISQFREVRLSRIPREQNTEADQLAKSASSSTVDDKIKIVRQSSLQATEINPVHTEVSWMTPIVSYLLGGNATRQPTRSQTTKDEASYVMREIHEGICGDHSGARALQRKIVRAGYYWPSMQADASKFVQRCDKCQRDTPTYYIHLRKCLVPMTTPWPFAQWGLDIMGPFPIGRRQLKFLVVAIDYFTKWVEAEPLATITERNIQNFVWKAVVYRFGIPRVLVSDNGKQFDNPRFRQFSQELGIHNHYSSPGHPQANGQVEVTNRSLLKLIKTRLEGAKGLWPEELPSILWAYRTTVRTPTGETPFRMTFGSEAVVPVEIGMTTLRTSAYNDRQNEEQLRLNLDLIDEVRETAEARMKRYQEKMARHYNSKVKPRQLSIGDLVLRKVTLATRNPSEGKLGPNWEGPYKVIEVRRPGTYHLEDMGGRRLPHPYHTRNGMPNNTSGSTIPEKGPTL
uniref:Uncharacterized protein n=1 Tax=Fagus sylvatica TaxID=28930 RepID=A0A2N9ED79_FAGSY